MSGDSIETICAMLMLNVPMLVVTLKSLEAGIYHTRISIFFMQISTHWSAPLNFADTMAPDGIVISPYSVLRFMTKHTSPLTKLPS